MNDKATDYFFFMHPNRWSRPLSFEHRLGNFQCMGIPKRIKPIKTVVLHILDSDQYSNGMDKTAINNAYWMANPDPNLNGTHAESSIHAIADRQNYVVCMPSDTIVYACANPNTRQESIEIEIAGTFKDHANPEYWESDDAKLKLVNVAKVLKQLQTLCTFEMPPLQKGHLNMIGQVDINGFIQHRDVPLFADGVWRQPPESFKYGQHQDICQDFPYEILFDIMKTI